MHCAASEIVDDFEDYGPVLQSSEAGGYDSETTIIKLKMCHDRVIVLLNKSGEG